MGAINTIRTLNDGERYTTLGEVIRATVGEWAYEDGSTAEYAEQAHKEALSYYHENINRTADNSTPLIITADGHLEGWHLLGGMHCRVDLTTP